MGSREIARMKTIDRLLAKAKRRYRKVSYTWAQIDAERRELARQIKALDEERAALAQGQLMFYVEQSK